MRPEYEAMATCGSVGCAAIACTAASCPCTTTCAIGSMPIDTWTMCAVLVLTIKSGTLQRGEEEDGVSK